MLANVYLHYALDLWFEHVVRRHVRGQATLIRYADDFVCAFEHEEDAAAFMRVLPRRLAKFGLETAPDKTGMHRFSRHQPEKNGTFSFLGFQYRWRTTRTGKSKVQRETDPRKLQKSTAAFKEWIKTTRHRRLDRIMQQLRRKLSGYWNYYGVSGNLARLCQFWWQRMGPVYKWLNRRSHKSGFTWKKFQATLRRYGVPGPHITDRAVPSPSAPASNVGTLGYSIPSHSVYSPTTGSHSMWRVLSDTMEGGSCILWCQEKDYPRASIPILQ